VRNSVASPDFDRAWDRILDRVAERVSSDDLTQLIRPLRPLSLTPSQLRLEAPNRLSLVCITDKYLDVLRDCVASVVGPRQVIIDLPVRDQGELFPDAGRRRADRRAWAVHSALVPKYTFANFVVGASNQFAHAASKAVATQPGDHYNPLFIYGGVGLGKTHLLFAIGHHMERLIPSLRVLYVSSETFVTEFIKAVRERQGYQFQRRYRDVDVLLVDDIQFLARREETQTEFFHTFNALHEAERQIVIASDRPPQELSGMEERLRNRFRWGLCVDVQPPDLETRIAILQLKAQRDDIVVPNEVLDFIASKFDQNIRELEGALLRAAAFSSLTGAPIDIGLAERALADLLPQSEIEIPPALIVDETAAYFGLTRADLVSKNRSRPLTTARHIAMYLLRETTSLSLIKIGEMFDRDHSTAMHGIRKVETDMSARGSTFRQVQDLTRTIRSRVRGG